MKVKTDVVIVGAGPAGTSTAISAAKAGAKVLILDRKSSVGVPVQCGEALGKVGPGLAEIEIPKEAIRNPIRGFRVYSPNLTPVDYIKPEPEGYIIDRRVFDKELLAKAAEMGADVMVNTNVVDLIYRDGKVSGVIAKQSGERIEIESKIVIGADGVFSIIAKLTGLRKFMSLKDLDASVGYEMINVTVDDQEIMEFYMGREVAPRGYVWIFPKGENRANVGIGIGGGYGRKSALEYMRDFIKKHPLGSKKLSKAKIIEFRVGAIPLGGPNEKNVLDNVMLVGDAAGQVHPITGGGIGYAMVCGSIAGKVAAECINKGDTSEKALMKYEELWRAKYGEEFRKMLALREILEKAEDETLDQLAEILDGKNIVDLTAGKKISILFKAISKRNRKLLSLINSFRTLKLIQ
ncbi:MAG: geranylgeranyl reductase family protein [Candidatus Odinarchaeia archaeon]